jgi:uncharacterized protein (TIGR03437 family)
MFIKKICVAASLCLTALIGSIQAQKVYLLPVTPGAQPISVFSADPLGSLSNSISAGNTPFLALATPSGNKVYIVSKSTVNAVVVLDGTTLNPTGKTFNFSQPPTAAVLTPDGRRLVVLADTVHIIDTSTDTDLATNITIASNTTLADVAASLDSSRVYILSKTTANFSSVSNVTAIDLTTNSVAVVAPQGIPGLNSTLAVGPNGLVYATAQNRIYELDPKTLVTRQEIAINGIPNKLIFTPDGKFAVTANQTPITGSSIILLDLTSHAVTPLGFSSLGPIAFDKLMFASNSRILAFSASNQKLYDITPSTNSATEASLSVAGLSGNILSATTSNEVPAPRFLYLTTAGAIYRFDPASLVASGNIPISTGNNVLVYAGPATVGNAALVLPYNNNQSVGVGQAYLPLVVRIVDANGRPLSGVPVAFTASDPTVTLSPASTTTTPEGFAQVNVIAGTTAGQFTVNVAAGTGATAAPVFTLTATGTSTGGGGIGTGAGNTNGALSIVSGNGQLVQEQFLTVEPLVVQVKDPQGVPIPNATVTFAITPGQQGQGDLQLANLSGNISNCITAGQTATCTTDQNGLASITFHAVTSGGQSFQPTTVTATYGNLSVLFTEETFQGVNAFGAAPAPTIGDLKPKPGDDRSITAQAGSTIPGAIAVTVTATGGPQQGFGIPNVGIEVSTGLDPKTGPTASCANGGALSDATGIASCDLVIGGKIGQASLSVIVGGGFNNRAPIALTVVPGPPAALNVLQGNNQSGNPGQQLPLALVAQVTDAFGNVLPGVATTFEVATPGTLTLKNVFSTSDSSGRVSTLVVLGGTPGPQTVRVKVGNTTLATFTETVNVSFGALTALSGTGQIAQINTAFAQPLTVRITDTTGKPVPNTQISFAVSGGSATLSTASATTDANGTATVSVTAGGSPGPITITASVGNLTASFNLTARLPGPQLTVSSFVNGASFTQGVVPGSIVTITGSGLAPTVQGVVTPGTFFGPLPTTLAGVDVNFGGFQAPIYSVSNVNGREQVTVQVPFELAPGPVSVTVHVNGGTTTVNNVPVQAVQPGIFEQTDASGRRFAAAQRPDGSYVTPANPAQRGENIRIYLTGLGQVSPGTGTNRAGVPGQSVLAPVIVGVNNAGAPVVSSEYLPGEAGVYVVTFTVPTTTPSGSSISLSVAVTAPDGTNVYSNGSNIAIQ